MVNLWQNHSPVRELGIDVPEWVDQDITPADVAAIFYGGCASGAYMPAVTYHQAMETMAEHGDDVLEFIERRYGVLPSVPRGESWAGVAVLFLSTAVELWVTAVKGKIEEALKEKKNRETLAGWTGEVRLDDLWLCDDCTVVAVTGDVSGLDHPERQREIEHGLEGLGAYLVPDYNSDTGEGIVEFSRSSCDCCDEWRGGSRTRFAVLCEASDTIGDPQEH